MRKKPNDHHDTEQKPSVKPRPCENNIHFIWIGSIDKLLKLHEKGSIPFEKWKQSAKGYQIFLWIDLYRIPRGASSSKTGYRELFSPHAQQEGIEKLKPILAEHNISICVIQKDLLPKYQNTEFSFYKNCATSMNLAIAKDNIRDYILYLHGGFVADITTTPTTTIPLNAAPHYGIYINLSKTDLSLRCIGAPAGSNSILKLIFLQDINRRAVLYTPLPKRSKLQAHYINKVVTALAHHKGLQHKLPLLKKNINAYLDLIYEYIAESPIDFNNKAAILSKIFLLAGHIKAFKRLIGNYITGSMILPILFMVENSDIEFTSNHSELHNIPKSLIQKAAIPFTFDIIESVTDLKANTPKELAPQLFALETLIVAHILPTLMQEINKLYTKHISSISGAPEEKTTSEENLCALLINHADISICEHSETSILAQHEQQTKALITTGIFNFLCSGTDNEFDEKHYKFRP